MRIGTVRRPPRGVRKEAYVERNYFDAWLPELAPTAPLVAWALSEPWTDSRWRRYARSYLAEMRRAPARRLIVTLAVLSSQTSFSVGCYCDDASRCHRSLLADLLRQAGADVVLRPEDRKS